mmetsp:Transcript_6186/g.13917  ORF Transcript_6186/g.13917 Transcript_6186/m.13917 type:complete len:206 (-) Transcript_6186:1599-2216(-)
MINVTFHLVSCFFQHHTFLVLPGKLCHLENGFFLQFIRIWSDATNIVNLHCQTAFVHLLLFLFHKLGGLLLLLLLAAFGGRLIATLGSCVSAFLGSLVLFLRFCRFLLFFGFAFCCFFRGSHFVFLFVAVLLLVVIIHLNFDLFRDNNHFFHGCFGLDQFRYTTERQFELKGNLGTSKALFLHLCGKLSNARNIVTFHGQFGSLR